MEGVAILASCRKPFLLTTRPAAAVPFGAHAFSAAMKTGCLPHLSGAMAGCTLESCPTHQDSLCPLQVFKVTGSVGGKPSTLIRAGTVGRDPLAVTTVLHLFTSTGYLWGIQLYSVNPKISPPALLLPPPPHPLTLSLPLPLPTANDDVEAERTGFDLQPLPPSMMDFPASHITFPAWSQCSWLHLVERAWRCCAWNKPER